MRLKPWLLLFIFFSSGCATGRDLTSPHYLPEWENKVVNFPAPSETSAGRWAVKSSKAAGQGLSAVILTPLAIAGNAALNAYYIPTWPFRVTARGDKRLLVWHPIFRVGSTVGSDFYSKEWNRDLV